MLRRTIVLGILCAAWLASSVDLGACGDKFLRVGKSGRHRGYSAVHRASILIYTPLKAQPQGIKDLEELLNRAGHASRSVKNGASLAQAYADAQFDLVIVAYADAGKIKGQLEALPSRPALLPILHNPTKAIAAEAERQYHFLLKTHAMSTDDALAEIDELMAQRLKGSAVAAR